MDTASEVPTAKKLKGTVISEWKALVRAEERSNLLRELVWEGLGTDDVENFMDGQRYLRSESSNGEGRDRDNIKNCMINKVEDSVRDEEKRRHKKNRSRAKLERLLIKSKSEYKRYINMVREKIAKLRRELRIENKNKVREIRIERKKEKKYKLPDILERYENAKIFSDELAKEFKPGDKLGPVIVGGNTKLLSQDEIEVLCRGPKFTIRRILSKERFLIELEKAFVKIRWSRRDEEDDNDLTVMDDEEKRRIEEIAELEAVKSRMVFDQDDLTLDMRKQRCTDVKHNSRIILPAPLTTKQEGELIMRRVEWESIFDQYVREFCDEDGIQESNLTDSEARGLKTLQKRVREGSLIICETDKSGRFAVMSQEEYLEAGNKHVSKDEEVGLEFMMTNQRSINGHMSMVLKTFDVGSNWNHQARIRATKLTMSLSVAPLYLLYKDHKGWVISMGGAPPTRPVASAGGGQIDHLSETVSTALEPVAGEWSGGMESNSTPDFVSRIVTLNKKELKNEEIDIEEVDRAIDDEIARKEEAFLHEVDQEIELGQQEGGEDDRGVSTEPAGTPPPDHGVHLAGEGSSQEDHQEIIDEVTDQTKNIKYEDDGHGMNRLNNLDKTYEKSINATKKTNKIENQTQKNNKTKNAQIQSNKVSHPEREKRTLSQTQGPDDPRPSSVNEEAGGLYGENEIFTSRQEEEASLLEDGTRLQEEFANCHEMKTKPDKVAIAEMLKRLTVKWSGTAYLEVVKLCVKFIDWHEVGNDIAYTLLGWMLAHDEDILVQETMHIVDGLDKLWESGEMAREYEEMLTESVEVLTALVVIWYQEHDQLDEEGSATEMAEGKGQDGNLRDSIPSPLEDVTPPTGWKVAEQEDSLRKTTPMRLSRAESMRRVREERFKMMNTRRKLQFKEDSTEDIQLGPKKAQRASTRKGKALLRASEVANNLVQDNSSRIVIIGADVDALYPSLEGVQVAEIIYRAVMETTVEFKGVNYQEGCRYIALTSTAQECRLGPLKRVLPIRRHKPGTRPGVTGAGPAGATTGDQEQWEFPRVELTKLEKRMIVARVMYTAVMALFKKHTYTFGGKYYLQKQGGPIGLRSTCCIARIVMIWWDRQLMEILQKSNLTTEERARYMDDIRLWMRSVRLGWRWNGEELVFCKNWQTEERMKGMTGLEKTLQVIQAIMNSICGFLKLTMESVLDFEGVLPTLDLVIWVGDDNKVLYRHYQKPMASNMVLQRGSAMPENMKVASLNQEVIRRMMNTSEDLDISVRTEVVDEYAQKLFNSGFKLDQTRNILVGGLTGYERKLSLSKDKNNPKWKPLHQPAGFNIQARRRTKLLGKSNWFKKKKDDDKVENRVEDEACTSQKNGRIPSTHKEQTDKLTEQVNHPGPGKSRPGQHGVNTRKQKPKLGSKDPPTIGVMFVDQTMGGVLAKRLQEVEDRLAGVTGYRIRMVESAGTQLRRLLPNTNPWAGGDCGRERCYTCNQGGEKREDCKRRNILYESSCTVCNPEIEGKKVKKKMNDVNGVYVGESARSIFERAQEHWADRVGQKEDSHMVKHWLSDHADLPEPPPFHIKVVSSFKDSMTRQISESVRIDLRGGGVLNSRTEYSRCRLPRLVIDMEEWRNKKKEERKVLEPISEEGMEWMDEEWDGDMKEEKRKPEVELKASQKRRKLEPLVEWGEATSTPSHCVRTWLLQDTILEEEKVTDWRQKTTSPEQMPSSRMKQMELDFGQALKGGLQSDNKWKSGKVPTGRLSKKEMRLLASTNQKINWKEVGGGTNLTEGDEPGLAQQEGGEDDSAVSIEPAEDPLLSQEIKLAGGGPSPGDPHGEMEVSRGTPGAKSNQINKLIKSYKKSRSATKKINKIKNKIKNNKIKKEQKHINTIIGHPDGEKRTFVPNLEGPDDLYVLEEVDDHQHGVWSDRSDHEELDSYIEELDIILGMEDEMVEGGQECAAHDELDQWWSKRHREEADGARKEVSMEEGVRRDWPEEGWKEEDTSVIFEEWLVLELSKLYPTVQDDITSTNNTHTPTKREGRGENNIIQDISDRVQTVHTAQNASLLTVRKVQEGGGN